MMRYVLAVILSLVALLTPVFTHAAVDLNSANESQLESLPGIGPGKARDIINERQANGPFKSVDDLGRVKGIGEKTIANLRSQATVGSQPATAGTTGTPSTTPAQTGKFPWALVAGALILVAAVGFFLLRRRAGGAGTGERSPSEAEATPEPQTAPKLVPRPVPAPSSIGAGAPSGPVPRPAGPAAGNASPKPAPGASGAPPAPAGPRPAGQPSPAAARPDSPPPPAPAGPKRKDS